MGNKKKKKANYKWYLNTDKCQFVPFQLCPKCNGNGTAYTLTTSSNYTTTTGGVCDLCNGAKVIPMAAIPYKS